MTVYPELVAKLKATLEDFDRRRREGELTEGERLLIVRHQLDSLALLTQGGDKWMEAHRIARLAAEGKPISLPDDDDS